MVSITPRRLITLVVIWSVLVLMVVCPIILLSASIPLDVKVVTRMMLCALVLWVGVGGALMIRHRERIVVAWRRVPGAEGPKFVLAATLLACIEESVTGGMTNLAPLFGGTHGVQGITNTTNYLHLVLLHSVVVFVPAFVVWSWLLRRYAFTAAEAFLLYGVTGALGEAITVRPDSALAGYWILVYGLFVWLPAETMRRPAVLPRPRPRHYVLAVAMPFPLAIPVAALAVAIDRALGLSHIAMHAS